MTSPFRIALLPFGLFTMIVLGLEIFVARLLAYTINQFLIYIALGIALTGLGIAGTLVALRPHWLTPALAPRAVTAWTLVFVWTTILACAIFVRWTPRLPLGIGWMTFAASSLLTLPFLAAGVVITLALSSAGSAVGHAYAADLVGSSLGCFLPFLWLGPLDGGRFIAALALGAWLAAALFFRRVAVKSRQLRAALWASLAFAVAAFVFAPDVFPIRPDPSGQVSVIERFAAQRGFRPQRLFDRWNITGRVEVFEYRGVPGAPDPYPFRFYAQDNTAGAMMARWDGKRKPEAPPGRADSSEVASMCSDTLFGQAHFEPRAKVLVIGVGGAADVQCALYHGADSVDAVEINPVTVAMLRGPFDRLLGGVGSNPRVHYYVQDGRSFAHAARPQSYDLIQLSGVDTKSMSATGALALSENHVYTREAFVDYLQGLKPGGVLSVIRFGEAEALRLFATGFEALASLGEPAPERQLIVAKNGIIYGLIVARKPFSSEQVERYRRQLWPADRPFRGMSLIFYEPFGYVATQPESIYWPGDARTSAFTRYVHARKSGRLRELQRAYATNIAPVTDDRPFFFDLTRYDLPQSWLAAYVPALLAMLAALFGLAFAFVLVPLIRPARERAALPALLSALYFSGIGLGFLFVEVWFIHRFSMFLGHQAYAMSVVLATLLLGTGLGAAVAPRLARAWYVRAWFGILGLFGALAVEGLLLPAVLEMSFATGLGWRSAITALFVLPAGFIMGFPFPAGVHWTAEKQPNLTAWAIGINFFASVVASVVSIPLALLHGYSGVLAAGVALYALALIATPSMIRLAPRTPASP